MATILTDEELDELDRYAALSRAWTGDEETLLRTALHHRAEAARWKALAERRAGWIKAQPHRADCEAHRVLGDPCGRVSAWQDPDGTPRYETTARPWVCFCGRDAALREEEADRG